ncbi:MAG TPA: hypothetical protein VKW78_20855 [Terriglobales bacterium]|nr:hypothetical protein [Terriglobales bacterium]
MQVQPVTIPAVVDRYDQRPGAAVRTGSPDISVPENSPGTLKLERETDDEKNTVYRLVEAETGQIISQVPSQQVLNVADSIEQQIQQEMQKPNLDVKS